MASITELIAATSQAAQGLYLPVSNDSDVFSFILKGIRETPANGNRNNFVHIFASDCNRFGVNENDCFGYLSQYAEKDFTTTEIKNTIRSAYLRTGEHATKEFKKHVPLPIYNTTVTTPQATPQPENDYSQFTGDILLKRNVQNIPTLITPLIPKVGLCAIAGSSDTGKSSLLRQMATAICLEHTKFLGFKMNVTHNRAIYVSTEDDDGAVSFLLNKANQRWQAPPEAYKGLTFIFDTTDLVKRLDDELKARPSDAVFIDAFSDVYGKSMNESNQVRFFLNDFHLLAQKHCTVIIFLHHTGKRTEDLAPSKNNLLGSQGFEAKMRFVAELRNDLQEPGKRHFCIVKGNYLPGDYKNESFVLNFDENMTFSKTEERTYFDELKTDRKQDTKTLALQMQSEGKTQTEIAKQLGLNQSTISRWLH
jgi:RecA-family ATPase